MITAVQFMWTLLRLLEAHDLEINDIKTDDSMNKEVILADDEVVKIGLIKLEDGTFDVSIVLPINEFVSDHQNSCSIILVRKENDQEIQVSAEKAASFLHFDGIPEGTYRIKFVELSEYEFAILKGLNEC